MQHQTTKLILKYKLATTILTQKAKLAGIAYNVNAHVAQLAQTGALPCHNATAQAVALNILHNVNFNFNNLCISFANLFNAYNNLHLCNNYAVNVTPTPVINYV